MAFDLSVSSSFQGRAITHPAITFASGEGAGKGGDEGRTQAQLLETASEDGHWMELASAARLRRALNGRKPMAFDYSNLEASYSPGYWPSESDDAEAEGTTTSDVVQLAKLLPQQAGPPDSRSARRHLDRHDEL